MIATNNVEMTTKNWDQLTEEEAMELDLTIFRAIKERKLAQLGEFGVRAVIERLNLEAYFDHFMIFNESHCAPYHNRYHTFCMVLNTYEGAYFERLTNSETRALVVAALFHDFNHTAGHAPDSENIERAIIGLNVAHQFASSRFMALTPEEQILSEANIRITLYPFTGVPSTTAEQIIRDADLMQAYEENTTTLRTQYLGLMKEIIVQRGEMSLHTFAHGMFDWLNVQVEWHSHWANEKAISHNWEMVKTRLMNVLING